MDINSIDYSQPGYKEMFANYGLTAISALSLEKAIWLLITAIDNLGKGTILDINEIQKQLKEHKRKPMGPLIINLQKRIEINNELLVILDEAKERRNYIIHHFFVERVDNLRNDPSALSNELHPIRDLFCDAHSKIDSLLERIIAEMHKPFDQVNPEIRRILKRTS
ncbi:MAG: hypothetical protein M1406_03905 [Nitrospirae bacterium]|nr:hypothetical protein [Nitrospirota bacterium]